MGWNYLSILKHCTVEVWKWIGDFIPHFTRCMITYPYWHWNGIVKGVQGLEISIDTIFIRRGWCLYTIDIWDSHTFHISRLQNETDYIQKLFCHHYCQWYFLWIHKGPLIADIVSDGIDFTCQGQNVVAILWWRYEMEILDLCGGNPSVMLTLNVFLLAAWTCDWRNNRVVSNLGLYGTHVTWL